MAIGPGMMISAWTAKLIFAHSTIPAYFIYVFPCVYSPLAWALYGIYYQLFPDSRLFVGVFTMSYWPVIMAALCYYYGLHREMSVARMMSVVNLLLLLYWMCLFVGYGFIFWFIFSYKAEGDDLISEQLNDEFSPRKLLQSYIAGNSSMAFFMIGVDSFALYFYTCCAVTDAFIVIIAQEHHQAWLMHGRSKSKDTTLALAGAGRVSLAAPLPTQAALPEVEDRRFGREEEVVKDWLHLVYGLRLPSQLRKQQQQQHLEASSAVPAENLAPRQVRLEK